MAVLGLDLGASKLAALVKDGTKAPCYYKLVFSNEAVFEEDKERMREFLLKIKNNIATNDLVSVALSSAATIDNNGTIIRWPNRPSWESFNLKSFVEDILQSPILVEDDGNAAALAEARALGVSNLLYIGIGSGISGGIVLSDVVLGGVNRCASEFGHVVIYTEGLTCTCGRHGCLQAYVSAGAFLKDIYGPQYMIKKKEDLVQLLISGDEAAWKVLTDKASILADFMVIISEILDVEVIVIGGGFGAGFKELHLQVDNMLHKKLRLGQRKPKIIPAYYGEKSSLMGATELASMQEAGASA